MLHFWFQFAEESSREAKIKEEIQDEVECDVSSYHGYNDMDTYVTHTLTTGKQGGAGWEQA